MVGLLYLSFIIWVIQSLHAKDFDQLFGYYLESSKLFLQVLMAIKYLGFQTLVSLPVNTFHLGTTLLSHS